MTIFIVLWPYLLTNKLRCLHKNNIGHTNLGVYSFNAQNSNHILQHLYDTSTKDIIKRSLLIMRVHSSDENR